jgi:hypothetical protein
MIPVSAAALLKAISPSGPPALPTPVGEIQIGRDTLHPSIEPLVDTVATFLKILGLNQIFWKKFLFASRVMLSFDAPEMNAQLFFEIECWAASSKSFRLSSASRGGFAPCFCGNPDPELVEEFGKLVVGSKSPITSLGRRLDLMRLGSCISL